MYTHTHLSKENITIKSSVDLRISFYPDEAVLLAVVQPMSSSPGPDQPLSLVHLHPHCTRQGRHTRKRGHGTHPLNHTHIRTCSTTPTYGPVQPHPCMDLFNHTHIRTCSNIPTYGPVQPHPCTDLFNHTHIWTCSTTPIYGPVQPHPCMDLFNHTHIRTCSTTHTYRPVQPHPLTYSLEQTHNSYWHTSQPSPPHTLTHPFRPHGHIPTTSSTPGPAPWPVQSPTGR